MLLCQPAAHAMAPLQQLVIRLSPFLMSATGNVGKLVDCNCLCCAAFLFGLQMMRGANEGKAVVKVAAQDPFPVTQKE